jgi:hypothetical protein
MLPLDPMTIGLGIALWLGLRKQTGTQFGVLTPQREEVYLNALEFLQDPMKLNELAEHYQQEGLKVQATMLRKRAEWRGRSVTTKAQHEHIFKQAMASTNVHAILGCAEAFEKMTATVKAQRLRDRAKTLYEENEAKAQNTVDDSAPTHAVPQESSVRTKATSNGAAKAESIPRNTEADTQSEIS